MSDAVRSCEHDVTESEVAAVSDGLCPLCLLEQTTALRAALESIRDYSQEPSRAFEAYSAFGFCVETARLALLAAGGEQ